MKDIIENLNKIKANFLNDNNKYLFIGKLTIKNGKTFNVSYKSQNDTMEINNVKNIDIVNIDEEKFRIDFTKENMILSLILNK